MKSRSIVVVSRVDIKHRIAYHISLRRNISREFFDDGVACFGGRFRDTALQKSAMGARLDVEKCARGDERSDKTPGGLVVRSRSHYSGIEARARRMSVSSAIYHV